MGEKILMSSRFLKTRFLGFTKRRMASIVKEENAVALIEEEQYHAGLITGLKVMNISVEVEKDPKKFRVGNNRFFFHSIALTKFLIFELVSR